MSAWRREPPTHDEWLEANNHGFWWVKFMLTPRTEEIDEETGETIVWPETWYTDCVHICAKGILGDDGLVGRGPIIGDIDFDDEEKLRGLYWQPVVSPLGDERDKEPVV